MKTRTGEKSSDEEKGDNCANEAYDLSKNNNNIMAAKSHQQAGAYYFITLKQDSTNENLLVKCRNAYEDAGDTYGKLYRTTNNNMYAQKSHHCYNKALEVSPEDLELIEKISPYSKAPAHQIYSDDKPLPPDLPPRQQSVNLAENSEFEAKNIVMLINLYVWHYDIYIAQGKEDDKKALEAIFDEIIKRVTLNQNDEVKDVKEKIRQDKSPAIENFNLNLNNHYKKTYDYMHSATTKLADAVGKRYDAAFADELDSLSGSEYSIFNNAYSLGESQKAANNIKNGIFQNYFIRTIVQKGVKKNVQRVPHVTNDISLAAVQGIGISLAIKALDSNEIEIKSNQTWDKYRDRTEKAYKVLVNKGFEKMSFLQWIRKDDSPISHWFDKAWQKIGDFFGLESAAKKSEQSILDNGSHKFWKPAGYHYKKQLKTVEKHIHLKPERR